MNLSKKGEYALRALLDLTMAQIEGAPLVPLAVLAESQKIPATFLEQILASLRQGGYLSSTRGKHGGYSLARPASEISVGDLIRFLDGPLAPIACASVSAYQKCSCPDEKHCGVRALMVQARNALSQVLDRASLQEMASQTLRHFRSDGLLPAVVERLRPAPEPAKAVRGSGRRTRTQAEPEYLI